MHQEAEARAAAEPWGGRVVGCPPAPGLALALLLSLGLYLHAGPVASVSWSPLPEEMLVGVQCTGEGPGLPPTDLASQPSPILTSSWPWANYLTSAFSFSFHSYKVGLIIGSQMGLARIK